MEFLSAAWPHGLEGNSGYFHSTPSHVRSPRTRPKPEYFETYPSSSALSSINPTDTPQQPPPFWVSYFAHLLDVSSQWEAPKEQSVSLVTPAKARSSRPSSTIRAPNSNQSQRVSNTSIREPSTSQHSDDAMSLRQPSVRFHLSTQRHQSQQVTPPSSAPTSSSPPQPGSSRLTTPEQPNKTASNGSSSLSSVPSSLGRTPEGLVEPKRRISHSQVRYVSPSRKSRFKRKTNSDEDDFQPEQLFTRALRRQKPYPKKEVQLPTPPMRRTVRRVDPRPDQDPEQPPPPTKEASRKRKLGDDVQIAVDIAPSPEGNNPAPSPPNRQSLRLVDAIANIYVSPIREIEAVNSSPPEAQNRKVEFHLDPDYKDKTYWPEYEPNKQIFFGADAATRYHAGSQRAYSATGSPRRNGRGGGGARGRGGGLPNGTGRGKGRPRGGGRAGRNGGDSPERKRALSPDAKATLMVLKQRQQELKRFFKVVGAQQYEILDQLAARDLQKLVRKAAAHQKMPEFNEVFTDLVDGMKEAIDLAKKRYDVQLLHEKESFERDKEIIDTRFEDHVENARLEHVRGAQGDLILLRQAHEAANDDTRTEHGSEVDYFPQYHPLPESGARVRGYYSHRITDEKPFKLQLSAYEDQARREVVDDDVLAPIAKALVEKNKQHRDEEARKKTQSMAALSEEASKQLEEMKGYLIPHPIRSNAEQSAFALSALADMSEWVAQRHPQQQYIYMPLASGDQFPRNALNYGPLPGTSTTANTPRPVTATTGPPAPRRAPPPQSPRSRPGQQGQQFVFQTPQHIYPHPQQPVSVQMAPQPRIPVTFVNQTVASRKQSSGGGGGAGSGGKGMPRMLLPKMG